MCGKQGRAEPWPHSCSSFPLWGLGSSLMAQCVRVFHREGVVYKEWFVAIVFTQKITNFSQSLILYCHEILFLPIAPCSFSVIK